MLNTIQSPHTLNIFGPNFQLRMSNLNEINSGREIPSTDITLTNRSIPQKVTPETPRVIDLSINNAKLEYRD